MTDPITAAAEVVRNHPRRIDAREELAEEVARAVRRELYRPVRVPDALGNDLTPNEEILAVGLAGLADDRREAVQLEALGRKSLALFSLEMRVRDLDPEGDGWLRGPT